MEGGGSPEIDQIIFFAIFFKKYKICRTFWYQVYPNRIKNKVSVIILVFFSDGVFFAEKANPYEKKVKKEKMHSFLTFYLIWINLVPKYCEKLI